MQRVLSVAEVKAAERNAYSYGLCEDVLIENAAAEATEFAVRMGKTFAVLVGGGNNGADALSLSRMILLKGKKVRVFLACEKMNLNAQNRLNAYKSLGGIVDDGNDLEIFDVIIDGVFGTGIKGAPGGKARQLICKANSAKAVKIALDIPSGLNADTGEAEGEVFKADYTVTFSHLKVGLIIGQAAEFAGKITVADIGIKAECGAFLADSTLLPIRKKASHKYNYGNIKIIGGSETCLGAPFIAMQSAQAALDSGAGLVTLCTPLSLKDAVLSRITQSMFLPIPDKDGEILFDKNALNAIMLKADAMAIGMGLKECDGLRQSLEYLIKSFDGSLVLDASAINTVAKNPDLLLNAKAKIILTPHAGEFARLIGGEKTQSDVKNIARAKEFAQKFKCVVLYKAAFSFITDGETDFYSNTGSPAMAKGGTGDILAGKVAAYCGVLPNLQAAAYACYSQGVKGEEAAKKKGEQSLTAEDLF